MKTGIVCAVEKELEPFLQQLEEEKTVDKAMLRFHIGKICGHDVITLFCGAGKVNAAIATEILIDTFGVDTVINAGVAGGIDPALNVFDTVISTEVAYHDVAAGILTEYHPRLESVYFAADADLVEKSRQALKNFPAEGGIRWGRMVTGEAFIEDEGRQEIIDKFNPLSVDMETGSIAHVCYVNRIPFIAVRSISDTADHSGFGSFEENCSKAAEIARDITLRIIDTL